MKVNKIRIMNLRDGDVLGKDLFVENRMLMKKGSALTARIIALLKNRNIQFVYIQMNEEMQIPEEKIITPKEEIESRNTPTNEETGDIPDYLQALAELSTEIRYGHALKDMEDILYVRDLFQKYMGDVRYRELFLALGKHDMYSYMHAIDVFTLGTLFAKREGIRNLEHYAIGFLLHDIGKLNTPLAILKKEGKLSNKEFTKMKEHAQDGYDILCKVQLESVAYLAKLHHERIDGSGYPEGLKAVALPKEVLILQLVDIYSAITLKRSYKAEIVASEAIATMYKEKHILDEKLLARFVDFIGIYPENAIVLLSDGTHAVVESVNTMYPLLPSVKRLDADQAFFLPVDFQLTIHKMLSLFVETSEQLFSKFSRYLMNGDFNRMEKYYRKLTAEYSPYECFSKIYIPTLKIFNIMKLSGVIDRSRLREVNIVFKSLLDEALFQLRKNNKKKEAIIFLVDKELKSSVFLRLIEGLFQTRDIYPFLLDVGTNEQELLRIANYCDASSICVISKEYEPIRCQDRKLNLYFISDRQLENFVLSFADEDYRDADLDSKLKNYKAVTKMLG